MIWCSLNQVHSGKNRIIISFEVSMFIFTFNICAWYNYKCFCVNVIYIIHNYTAYNTQLYSLHTTIQPIHYYTAYTQHTAHTQLYSLYTAIRPVHNYTAYTLLYSLYTAIRSVHHYTAYTLLYSLYTTIQPIHNIQPNIHNYTAYFIFCYFTSVFIQAWLTKS